MREARPAPAEAQEQARRLAALLGLRRCPVVAFVSAPLSPMLWALGFSPRLLLPAELWQQLGETQRETLLAHELAHLRRGDHWVRRLEFVVLGLYWWHPVVWWARRRLQEAEEECCDARVVAVLPEAASDYAAALVETVAFLARTRAAALVGASGAGQVPLLKRRLTMILTAKPSSRGSRAVFWAVLGMGFLLLPLAPGLARVEALGEAEDSEAKSPAGSERERVASESPHQKIHQLQLDMQNCASCHDRGTHQLGTWLRKPQAWREAHDEAVRLLSEIKRLQSQFRETAQRLPPPTASSQDELIEKLSDEIELLQLQVKMKEARLRSAKGALDQARQLRDSALKQNKQVPGSVAREEIMKATSAVDSLTADAEIKAIELEETAVRLKQAERHLARLQRPAKQSSPQPPQSLSLDLGSHRHGTIIERSFPLRNGHGSPLRIASIRSSSGALSVRTFQKEIASGEKGDIVLRLDTGRFVGSKTFTLFIQFEGGQPEIRVRIHTESVPPPPTRTATAKPDKEAQLKELERKLEILLKEVRDLQREKRPDLPRDPYETPKSNRP